MPRTELSASQVVGAEIVLQPHNGDWSWITSGFITGVDGTQVLYIDSREDAILQPLDGGSG